jgi:hypothetical protein
LKVVSRSWWKNTVEALKVPIGKVEKEPTP